MLVFVITGPSGSGKSTIISKLKQRNIDWHISRSCTTREPRETEKNGIEYFFIEKQEFVKKIISDEFVEFTIFNDKFYGTLKSELKAPITLVDVEYEGVMAFKKSVTQFLTENKVEFFYIYIYITEEECRKRLMKRDFKDENDMLNIENRIKTYKKHAVLLEKCLYDVVITNNKNVELAVNKVEKFIYEVINKNKEKDL